MESILSLKNLDKKYGNIHAVNNLSFEIKKGNIYGILGPNGSGKSTTLGMILNVVNPTSGNFYWFNKGISTYEALKKVGAIIERPNFYPYMTAKQNLELVCKIKEVSKGNIDEKLKIVDLFKRRNSKFSTFSLGMKQRLAIASALLNNPEVLILDEPTNGLDPQGIHEIREIIKQVASKGTTIILASHLLDEVEKVCSHVIVINNGKKQYEGRMDEITSSYGFFDLKTEENNQEKVMSLLLNYEGISSIRKDTDGMLIASLKKDISSSEVNKFLFDNGIVLSYLVKRKPSLEQQYLSLTNDT